MSSSTVTKPYITESWIHMQQQAHGLKSSSSSKENDKETTTTDTITKIDSDTNIRKSSIVPKRTQEGMSRSGIYEAFKEAENWDDNINNNKKSPAIKAVSTRKSTATTTNADLTKKKTSVNSPRLRSVATKKSNESIRSPSLRSITTTVSNNNNNNNNNNNTSIIQGRRQTLSGRSTINIESGDNSSTTERRVQQKILSPGGSGNGLIKLADTLRDTLAVERRLAKQELGIYNTENINNNNKKPSITTTARIQRKSSIVLTSPPGNNNKEEEKGGSLLLEEKPKPTSAVEIFQNSQAKRRASMITREKVKNMENSPRRRTLSSGTALLVQQHQQALQQTQRIRNSKTPPTISTHNNNEAGYMKSTLAEQRRHSNATNNSSTSPHSRHSASPRKNSILSTKERDSSPLTSEEDNKEDSLPIPNSIFMKRKSILAAATAKAHQQQQQKNEENNTNTSSGDESKSIAITPRGRKKSMVMREQQQQQLLAESVLAHRRRSRTESLKEGVPTSPSLAAARMARRKSVLKQEVPVIKKKESSEGESLTSAKKTPTVKKTVRKRGQTLPGSLAKQPTVQSLNLPPMKVEPIKLNIPKTGGGTKRITAKSPSIRAVNTSLSTSRRSLSATKPDRSKKRLSTASVSTTPVPASSSSSSSSTTDSGNEAKASPKKTPVITARKVKGLSHSGITTIGRRASLKTPTITPPSKTPTNNASPRVGPRSTASRRQSLAVESLKNQTLKANQDSTQKSTAATNEPVDLSYTARSRKMSVTNYTSNNNGMYTAGGSRKNSLASGEQDGLDKGRRAISLREKLEAMVAQHAIHDDYSSNNNNSSNTLEETSNQYNYLRERIQRKSQTLDMMNEDNNKYMMLLTAEERARPQRIKESLMMWDKEMVEAFSPGMPKTPQVAIKFYGHYLSPFEQTEIHRYPEVYFVGHQSKKHQAMPDNSSLNYGYDDERGDYKSVTNDHLAYRYEVLEELGRGSFGQVVKCYDHKTAQTVAVKLIRNKKRFYAQAKTEVKILSDLVEWDPEDRHHNIRMTDNFYFRNHLCIVCECLSMNLYEFIKINNFQGFHVTLIKRFTVQLLRSLQLLQRHGVVHCDLKPENILLKHPTKSTIKVIDFGSSCFESERVYTYIQSRFYRSPEIILGLNYSMSIDMWSLGCILAELYTGVPIFPGENEQEQLACIMEVMGVPNQELIYRSERRHLFFDSRGAPRVVCNSRGKKRRAGTKNLNLVLRCSDSLFVDFIQKCLEWDPEKRMNPEEALQHEWIQQPARPPNIRHASVAGLQSAEDGEDTSSTYSSRKNSLGIPTTDTRPQT